MVLVREQAMESNQRLSDAHVKDDHSDGEMLGSLEDDAKVTDKGRRKKQQSPTKRRKIEHESSLLFEVFLVWSSRNFSFRTYMQFAQNFECCLAPTRTTLHSRSLVQPAMSSKSNTVARVSFGKVAMRQCLVWKLKGELVVKQLGLPLFYP